MMLLPSPPTEDNPEAKRRVTLKKRFSQMHVALQSTEYDNIKQLLYHHAVTSDEDYVFVLRTGITHPTFIQRTAQ